jgi:hypothetical protein
MSSRRVAAALVIAQVALATGAGWLPRGPVHAVEVEPAPKHESAHGGGHDHTHEDLAVVVPRRPGRRVRRLDVSVAKVLV